MYVIELSYIADHCLPICDVSLAQGLAWAVVVEGVKRVEATSSTGRRASRKADARIGSTPDATPLLGESGIGHRDRAPCKYAIPARFKHGKRACTLRGNADSMRGRQAGRVQLWQVAC